MLRSFKTQGTKTKTILTLATVGIISAFLVGSPQHASADQTYVSDPNQAALNNIECLSDDRNQGGTTERSLRPYFGMELFYFNLQGE